MSVEQSNKNNNNKTLWFKATRGYQVLIAHGIWLVTGCLWNHLHFSTCLAGCSLLSLLLWTFLLGLMFVVLCAGLDGSLVVLMVHVFLWMFSASCLWIFSFWLVAVPRHCKWALSNLFFWFFLFLFTIFSIKLLWKCCVCTLGTSASFPCLLQFDNLSSLHPLLF